MRLRLGFNVGLKSWLKMFCDFCINVVFILVFCGPVFSAPLQDLIWAGGPLSMECEQTKNLFTLTGQHVKENVIVIKALPVGDDIYVISPRFKQGVLATVWQIALNNSKVELLPFPDKEAHATSKCEAIQNTVDFSSDFIGNLWVLDTGIIDNLERPICTCPPKVVLISTILKKIVKTIDLSRTVAPESVLQNIVVEYNFGGLPFIYVSDASRGAVIIHDVTSGKQWTINVSPPTIGLQLALVRRYPGANTLMMVRLNFQGFVEADTTKLRMGSVTPLRMMNTQLKPVVILGSDLNHIYFRYTETNDIFSWEIKLPLNVTGVSRVHLPDTLLTTTSVALDPLKHALVILDSNYGYAVAKNEPTLHKISFVMQKLHILN